MRGLYSIKHKNTDPKITLLIDQIGMMKSLIKIEKKEKKIIKIGKKYNLK